MEKIFDHINGLPPFANVLLVCNSENFKASISERLADRGVNIIGPAAAAGPALVLAAQTSIDLALIEPELAGRRDGAELAQRLQDDWGVPSLLLDAEPAD